MKIYVNTEFKALSETKFSKIFFTSCHICMGLGLGLNFNQKKNLGDWKSWFLRETLEDVKTL
jgi:hypothetical protein